MGGTWRRPAPALPPLSLSFPRKEVGSCLSSMDDLDCDSTWEDESEEDGEDGQADDTGDEDTGDEDGDAEETRPGVFQVQDGGRATERHQAVGAWPRPLSRGGAGPRPCRTERR